MNLLRYFSAILLMLFAIDGFSQRLPNKATHTVMDLAELLTPIQKQHLYDTIEVYETKTSNQLVVLIGKTLNGQNIDEVGPALAEKWEIGQAGRDNGILFSIFLDDRTSRIDVGYGLESYLTDAKSKWILDKKMIPEFKKGLFYEGIKKAVYQIMAKTDSAYVVEQKIEAEKRYKAWQERQELEQQAEYEIHRWEEKYIYTGLSASFFFLVAYIIAFIILGSQFANTAGVKIGEKPAFTDPVQGKAYFKKVRNAIAILGGIVILDNVLLNFWNYPVELGDKLFVSFAMLSTALGYITIQVLLRRRLKGKERMRLVFTILVIQAIIFTISFIAIQGIIGQIVAKYEKEIEGYYYFSYDEPYNIIMICSVVALFAHLLLLLVLKFSGGGSYSYSGGSSYSSGRTYTSSRKKRKSYSSSSSYRSSGSSSSSSSSYSGSSSSSSSYRSSGSFSGGGGKFGGGGASSSW